VNLAFTNPPLNSISGSHELADAAMFPKGEASYITNFVEETAPLNIPLSRKGHIDESNIKIHNNDEDSNSLFSSLNSECEYGISSKKTFDNLQNTERYSENPQILTSTIATIATRTNSEEGDDMDIDESDTEQELNVASCGDGKSDTLLPTTRVSRRKKVQVLWTRTVQFASSFPDAIPNSIRNPLLELAARTRKKGYLIKLIPEQRRPFIDYCVKTLMVPPKVAEEIFSFLESKRVSEFRWKKALESYQISSCDDTVVQDIVRRLKIFALKGLLCPRNKVDFFYFCDICFPPVSLETCDRVYDYLASHIPEFSAYVVRKPWDGLNSMAEKIAMLPNWSQNEKMLFVIEHVVVDDLDFFCPFRSLLLALQSQSKQFSESIFSYRGVSNRKKFFKYCKETFTGMAENDVRKAFQFISKKIKEYESQALTKNLSHDKTDQSDESMSAETMHVKGQGRNSLAPKSLPLNHIAELSAISEDAHVSNKPQLSDTAGLRRSKNCSINTGVDSINFKSACVNNFKAIQSEVEDNDFSPFRQSEESGKHLSTTQHLVEDDTEVPKKAQLKKLLLGRVAEIATTADDAPVFIRALISKLATLSQSNGSDTKTIVDLIGFQRMCIKNFNATQAEAIAAYKFLLSRHKKDLWQMKRLGESDSTLVEKKALKQPQLKLLLGRIAEIAAAAHDAPVSIKPLLSKLATLTQSKDSSTKTIVDPSIFHSMCINNFHASQAEAKEAYNFLVSRETDKAPKIPWNSCSDKVLSEEDDKEAPKPKQAHLTKLLLDRITEIATTADDAPDSIRELMSKLATIGQENDSSPKKIVDAVRFESMCINNFHATEAEAKEAYQFLMSRQKDSDFKALVNHISQHSLNRSYERRHGRQHVRNSTINDHTEDDHTTVNRHEIELSGNDAGACSTNLVPLKQCSGSNRSELLFQQNNITFKRDEAFQPSSLAMRKGAA